MATEKPCESTGADLRRLRGGVGIEEPGRLRARRLCPTLRCSRQSFGHGVQGQHHDGGRPVTTGRRRFNIGQLRRGMDFGKRWQRPGDLQPALRCAGDEMTDTVGVKIPVL